MNSFLKVVESLDISPSLKQDLTDPELLKSHALYIHLVDHMLPLFPEISKAVAEKLTLSGYLYFRFLLFCDNHIDELKSKSGRGDASQQLFAGIEFHEKSIQGLSQLFAANDSFWEEFQNLKREYYSSIKYEKTILSTKPPLSKQEFIELAAGKSSLCNAMVYALSSLAQNKNHNAKLLQCIREIHISLQYLDDIEDFKTDILNNQWTYVQHLVSEHLKHLNLLSIDPDKLNKHLFVSGIATTCIKEAIAHLERAIDIASGLMLQQLVKFLMDKKQAFNIYLQEIDFVIAKTKVKATKQNQLISSQSLSDTIHHGVRYLEEVAEQDRSWTDFLTSAGFGKRWITAYVGYQMTSTHLPRHILENASAYLKAENSASFNDTIIQDGDSTTFRIAFLKSMNKAITTTDMVEWLKFMNPNGGWVTYREGDALVRRLNLQTSEPTGWLTEKNCVSASAAYVLSLFEELELEYSQTCKFLLGTRTTEGYWQSYWWTSATYATSFAIMALSATSRWKSEAQKSVAWLIDRQHSDGFWENDMLHKASAFYTALAIKALMLFNPEAYKLQIQNGIHWLRQHQTIEGSWLPTRILRIPATDVENPDEVKRWRASSLGVNCVVDDHNRVFTTSTVVSTMTMFSKLYPRY